jgi:ubiquinone/menaquinone biosynthesis C-methylase UbiE
MLNQAKTKSQKLSKILTLKTMDAHFLQFPDNSFDVVIDTFGLCSYHEPLIVLNEMNRVCSKTSTTSRIYLIEHGIGYYDWINHILHSGANHHAHKWGCIWNRDIIQLVKQSNLEIVSVSRYHFGTTYVIEAKPRLIDNNNNKETNEKKGLIA